MKKRIKLKQRTLPSKINKIENLERETKKTVAKVNERIKSIRKKYKTGKYTWSITNIKNMLPKFYKDNRIIIPKKPKEIELLNILKESRKFLESKASTKKGIEEIKERAKTTLKETLSDIDVNITEQDVDDYYSMFEDNDFNNFIKETGLTASEVWAIMDDSIRSGDTENNFINRLNTFINIQDEDIKNRAIRLYNKYVK